MSELLPFDQGWIPEDSPERFAVTNFKPPRSQQLQGVEIAGVGYLPRLGSLRVGELLCWSYLDKNGGIDNYLAATFIMRWRVDPNWQLADTADMTIDEYQAVTDLLFAEFRRDKQVFAEAEECEKKDPPTGADSTGGSDALTPVSPDLGLAVSQGS